MWKWLSRTYREAYAGLPTMAWILALVEFINRSGTMVLFFLVLYMTHRLGFSTTAAGTAAASAGAAGARPGRRLAWCRADPRVARLRSWRGDRREGCAVPAH